MHPTINSPCPEKWDSMKPEEHGRFCDRCCKVISDFTEKTTEEIVQILSFSKEGEICGRVKKSQLSPVKISVSSVIRERLRIFSVALYLVFGAFLFTGCGPDEDEHPVGIMCIDSTTEANNLHYSDSIASLTKKKTPSDSLTDSANGLDSATMMNTLKLLDSVAAIK